jgi:hypothetical protein
MFTIKFYSDGRQKILSAESFTILRGGGGAEITLHQKNQHEDRRIDIASAEIEPATDMPPVYQRAIIENAAGKTTEIIEAGPAKIA